MDYTATVNVLDAQQNLVQQLIDLRVLTCSWLLDELLQIHFAFFKYQTQLVESLTISGSDDFAHSNNVIVLQPRKDSDLA